MNVDTMKVKPFKVIIGSLLIAFLLIAALALPVWYVYSQGRDFVADADRVARQRSAEIGITLNTLSGESLYYDNLIALSSTMNAIVRQSATRQDPFAITEIFLVDKDGVVLAHSDIARVAFDSGTKYDNEKFQFGQVRFKGDPLTVEVTKRVEPEFGPFIKKAGLEPAFRIFMGSVLPDLSASDFHIAGSVYMPDEVLPSGSVHILIHNANAITIMNRYSSTVLQTLVLSVVGALLLWLIFTIVLGILVFTNHDAPSPIGLQAANSSYDEFNESLSPIDDEFEVLSDSHSVHDSGFDNVADLTAYRQNKRGDDSAAQTDIQSGVYDAIPLDKI